MRPPQEIGDPPTADRATRMPTRPDRRSRGWELGLVGAAGLILVVLALVLPSGLAVGSARPPTAAALPAALAPANWTQVTGLTHSPPPRQSGSMVYDVAAKEFVLFGGYSNGALGDTWTFTGLRWVNLSHALANAPSPRWYYGMTWDAADHYVVLFGGRDSATDFNDTWTFNGTGWTNVSATVAPPPMTTSRFVYDAVDGYVLLYGGNSIMPGTPSAYDVVWTFHAGTWTNITARVRGLPSNPDVLTDGVYDPATYHVVFFGGDSLSNATCTAPGSTWTYANGTFRNITRSTGPAPLLAAGSRMLSYDASIHGLVLYGGWDGSACPFSNETWEYQSGGWSQVVLGHNPGPLWDGDMATNTATGKVILFGGNTAPFTSLQSSETWRFTP
jgi:hypothetical protein